MSIINENNNDDDDTNDNENTVETALSPLISWCVTAVTMSFVVSLEHCSCFDHQFQQNVDDDDLNSVIMIRPSGNHDCLPTWLELILGQISNEIYFKGFF